MVISSSILSGPMPDWETIMPPDLRIERAYRADLIVEDLLVVEIKAVEAFHPVHRRQLISYLKCSGAPAGLL